MTSGMCFCWASFTYHQSEIISTIYWLCYHNKSSVLHRPLSMQKDFNKCPDALSHICVTHVKKCYIFVGKIRICHIMYIFIVHSEHIRIFSQCYKCTPNKPLNQTEPTNDFHSLLEWIGHIESFSEFWSFIHLYQTKEIQVKPIWEHLA